MDPASHSTLFPPTPEEPLHLCSYNECSNGHRWPPQMALTPCPSCRTTIVAVKMVNCPYCNEPVSTISYRHDHLSSGMTVAPLCDGTSTSLAEVTTVTLTRTHHSHLTNPPTPSNDPQDICS